MFNWDIILGAIKGIFLGAILGLCVWWIQCVASGYEYPIEEIPPTALVVGGIIGGIVGYILEKKSEDEYQEHKRQKEFEERVQAAESVYQNWKNNLEKIYLDMINKACSMNTTFTPVPYYEKIEKQLDVEASITDSRYKETYELEFDVNKAVLKDMLFDNILKRNTRKDIRSIESGINLLCCLNYVENKEVNKKALDVMNEVLQSIQLPLAYLEEKAYGDFILPLDDDKVFQEMKMIMENEEFNQISSYLDYLENSKDILIEVIAEGGLLDFLKLTAKVMWYYAKLKPFDVKKFELSVIYFDKYRLNNGLSKVEAILAKIYAKNQLSGKEGVRQDLETIEQWIEKEKNISQKDCILLASGLAWMELYEIELHLLRKFVEMKIQLPGNVQERLSFLENGGTADIKVYQIEPSNDFVFDSDSLDWNAKDYSIFFRKLSMKKMDMNYSLAHTKWTKTLPLASGQKISFDDLYNEFVKLVDDFDGEITCETALAKAVNLTNLEYPDATIFRFTKERNRCISVLVSCEKYGRNLNTTIITMFTPDNSLEVDLLEQYCQAIKNNRYVESFRESISQVIDTILNPVQSAYSDVFE